MENIPYTSEEVENLTNLGFLSDHSPSLSLCDVQRRTVGASRRLLKTAAMLLVIILASPALAGPSWWGVVTDVIDGDTFQVRQGTGEVVKVRLAQIDAPEADQPFGKKATENLSLRIKGGMSKYLLGKWTRMAGWLPR